MGDVRAATAVGGAGASAGADADAADPRCGGIDSHVHLWQYDAATASQPGQYEWMQNLPPAARVRMQRDFLPEDLASALRAGGGGGWGGGDGMCCD